MAGWIHERRDRSVRPATAADRTAILELAPRLAEGVAPWRSHQEAASAGRKWLDGSLDEEVRLTRPVRPV